VRLTDGPLLWYLNRGTGVVLVGLLTLSVAIGVLSTLRATSRYWPRFATQSLHRNVSLLATALLLAHVASAVLDTFVTITWTDSVVPFVGGYRPFWLGLGALALDLMAVVVATSLFRRRMPRRGWRVTHLLSYLGWAAGVLHGVGIGTDTATSWAGAVTIVSVGVVATAVVIRLATWAQERRLSARMADRTEPDQART
jgi:predicted ferric reductase